MCLTPTDLIVRDNQQNLSCLLSQLGDNLISEGKLFY